MITTLYNLPKSFSIVLLFTVVLFGCEVTKPENMPDSYAKEVDKVILKKHFPNQHKNFFMIGGNSPYIKSLCPVVERNGKYIKVNYDFSQNISLEDIAIYNIQIEWIEPTDTVWPYRPFLDKYYIPTDASNSILIENNFRKGKYRMWYGFYLKSDSLKSYPKLHKQTCYFVIR